MTRNQIKEHFENIFAPYELGDTIQVLDEHIYIEVWVNNVQYKVRYPFYYDACEDLDLQNLTVKVLRYLLALINKGSE